MVKEQITDNLLCEVAEDFIVCDKCGEEVGKGGIYFTYLDDDGNDIESLCGLCMRKKIDKEKIIIRNIENSMGSDVPQSPLTAYQKAMKITQATVQESEQKRKAMKGEFLGKVESEDAYQALIACLQDGDLDMIKDCLELVSGAIIEYEDEQSDPNGLYFEIYKTNDYMDFFDSRLKK